MFIDTAVISVSGDSQPDVGEGSDYNVLTTWRNIVATLKGLSGSIEPDTSQFSEYRELKEKWLKEIVKSSPKHLKGRLEFGDW